MGNNKRKEILLQILEKEYAYKEAPNTGTRCELIGAYLSAANHEYSTQAGYDGELFWYEKACLLAQEGVNAEPCFVSLWDAAVVYFNKAEFTQRYYMNQEASTLYKTAAEYLKKIIADRIPPYNADCNAEEFLAKIESRYNALEN